MFIHLPNHFNAYYERHDECVPSYAYNSSWQFFINQLPNMTSQEEIKILKIALPMGYGLSFQSICLKILRSRVICVGAPLFWNHRCCLTASGTFYNISATSCCRNWSNNFRWHFHRKNMVQFCFVQGLHPIHLKTTYVDGLYPISALTV